jgi:RNA-directed DNA polymerase
MGKVAGRSASEPTGSLVTYLRRRFKLHSRAQARHRLPSSKLYGSYNLYKLPTTAAWRKAHAL